MTKSISEEHKKKDCTKRNILYEIRCLTCEKEMKEKIETESVDQEEKNEKIRNMKNPVYVGESSRSAYERGFEHLNNYTSLNSKSHMLRHIVEDHGDQEMDTIKWGMFIIEYKRTAFERQIGKAVKIQQTAKDKKILNSRSEWNQSALPSLVIKIGNKKNEIK